MDKETIFKEIRNRAVKDDTDLGDIIYDVLNGLYPNELKEYDLSVLDPRRGVMNPYDIIDVILKDASKEEVEQKKTVTVVYIQLDLFGTVQPVIHKLNIKIIYLIIGI